MEDYWIWRQLTNRVRLSDEKFDLLSILCDEDVIYHRWNMDVLSSNRAAVFIRGKNQ